MSALAAVDIQCRSCGAALVVEAQLKTTRCPYCASTSVVDRPASTDRPDPSYALGFAVDHERAGRIARTWGSSRGPFAHSGLKRARLEDIRGVYLPAYLYGAEARTHYRAEIGENYTVSETYTTTDSKGNSVTRTRTVTKTEWRSLRGMHAGYVLDVLVTASRGIPNEELEQVEPFDLRRLQRYDPALLSGWIAEEPSLEREQCRATAHDESVERIGRELADFMPGDGHRDLDWQTTLSAEVIDLVLLPVWVFAVRYSEERPPVRLLINGQTGEAQGQVPLSVPKIVLAVLLGLLLLAGGVMIFIAIAGR